MNPLGYLFAAFLSMAVAAHAGEPDSQRMESDLQRLPWNAFKSVIESVPKLKAGVDAYGPMGWEYVKGHYARYGWKKQIDKLDPQQKRQLATLIQDAKKSE